jgi:hypothetical protein
VCFGAIGNKQHHDVRNCEFGVWNWWSEYSACFPAPILLSPDSVHTWLCLNGRENCRTTLTLIWIAEQVRSRACMCRYLRFNRRLVNCRYQLETGSVNLLRLLALSVSCRALRLWRFRNRQKKSLNIAREVQSKYGLLFTARQKRISRRYSRLLRNKIMSTVKSKTRHCSNEVHFRRVGAVTKRVTINYT